MECQADRDTIEETMECERTRSDDAASRMWMIVVMSVQYDHPIEDEIGDEAERDDGSDECRCMRPAREFERFRHEIEERDADDGTRAEAEDEVQAVLEA